MRDLRGTRNARTEKKKLKYVTEILLKNLSCDGVRCPMEYKNENQKQVAFIFLVRKKKMDEFLTSYHQSVQRNDLEMTCLCMWNKIFCNMSLFQVSWCCKRV